MDEYYCDFCGQRIGDPDNAELIAQGFEDFLLLCRSCLERARGAPPPSSEQGQADY